MPTSARQGACRNSEIWPCGIFARGHLSPIISSGDEGTVSLQTRRCGYRTDDNRDSWGEFGGRTRPGGVAPGCRVRYTPHRRSSRETTGAAPPRGQATAPRPHPERRVQGDYARGYGQHARRGENTGTYFVYDPKRSPE